MDLNFELNGQLQFILDLGVAIGTALLFGVIAVRLRQPPILGYLIAGIVIGPFTPGFVGDARSISELADLGVVLLLFALGIEFTLRELRIVARVAPGQFCAQRATVRLAQPASDAAAASGRRIRAHQSGGAVGAGSRLDNARMPNPSRPAR